MLCMQYNNYLYDITIFAINYVGRNADFKLTVATWLMDGLHYIIIQDIYIVCFGRS